MRRNDPFWTLEPTKARPWEPKRNTPRFYRPFTTRTPWLVTVLALVLACIASLEIAFNSGSKPSEESKPDRLAQRQETTPSAELTRSITPDDSLTGLMLDATTIISTATSLTTNSPKITSTTTLAPTTSPPILEETTDGGDYLTIDKPSTSDVTASTDPGDFLLITTTTSPVEKPTTTSTTSEIIVASAAPGSFLTLTTTTPTSDTTPVTGTAGDVPVITTSSSEPALTEPALTVVTVTEQTSIPPITLDETTRSATSSKIFSVVTVAISKTILTTTDDEGRTTIVSTATTVTPSPTRTQGSIATVEASQIQLGTTFTHRTYFVSTYLAVLIAVCLKLTWGLVFSGLKLMEPFYQLTKEGGATASESLLADYLSAGYSWGHIRHILTGHWVMLLSTVTYLAMAVLSPVASEAMGVIATSYCPNKYGNLSPCAPVWVVNVSVARGLEAVLCLIAILILFVIILNWPRKSGIFNNPSSVASMASLLSHQDMLLDLRQLDQRASDKSVALALSGARYTMTSYEASPGSGIYRYGVTRTTSTMNNPYSLASAHNFDHESRNKYAALSNPTNMYLQDSEPIREQKPFSIAGRLVRDGLFLCCLLALFGVVLGYYLEGANTAFNRFFNSGTFGPKFILTSVAALVDFQWKTMEREVRIMTPYRHLHARGADAKHSVLVDADGTPISSIWGALARGEVFHSVVALTAILSDCLIIAVAGIPFSSANIFEAFLLSSYISLAILGFMILVMFPMLWWRLQVQKMKMPREPDTLLAIWLTLCDQDNEVRREFDGWETTHGGHRDRAARGRGTRYWGGWARSLDGRERWSVSADGQRGTIVGHS